MLYALLRHAGRPVQLWIGVRRDPDAPDGEGVSAVSAVSAVPAVSAHAWLTSGGEPYLEAYPDHPARHTPIARFPEPLPR